MEGSSCHQEDSKSHTSSSAARFCRQSIFPCVEQEDGLKKAVEAFHAHLPLEMMKQEEPLNWHLARPHFVNVVSETGRGILGIFSEPVRGYREGGKTRPCSSASQLDFLYVLSMKRGSKTSCSKRVRPLSL